MLNSVVTKWEHKKTIPALTPLPKKNYKLDDVVTLGRVFGTTQ